MEVDDGLSSNAKERSTLALPGAPRGPRGKERSKYTEDDIRAALAKMLAQYEAYGQAETPYAVAKDAKKTSMKGAVHAARTSRPAQDPARPPAPWLTHAASRSRVGAVRAQLKKAYQAMMRITPTHDQPDAAAARHDYAASWKWGTNGTKGGKAAAADLTYFTQSGSG